MPSPLSDFEQTLKKHHQNSTAARRKVFTTLQEADPMTMSELVTACSPDINRSSVYRTVELFEKLGIILRIQIGWKYKLELSEPYQQHHHHMYCTQCANTYSVPEDTMLETRLHALATHAGFIPESHQIEITGTCASCTL